MVSLPIRLAEGGTLARFCPALYRTESLYSQIVIFIQLEVSHSVAAKRQRFLFLDRTKLAGFFRLMALL